MGPTIEEGGKTVMFNIIIALEIIEDIVLAQMKDKKYEDRMGEIKSGCLDWNTIESRGLQFRGKIWILKDE